MLETAHVIFLLGAGASKGVGLPTSAELFRHAGAWIQRASNPDARITFNLLAKKLLERNRVANIEDLLTAVSALATRNGSELWLYSAGLLEPLQTLAERNARKGGPTAIDFFDALYEALVGFVRTELGGFGHPTLSLDGVQAPAAEQYIQQYLQRVISLALRTSRPTIYTLNYDLSVEMNLDAMSVAYSTGFIQPKGIPEHYLNAEVHYWPFGYARLIQQYSEREPSGGRLDLFGLSGNGEPADLRLLKLHGSLDWYRVAASPVYEGGVRLAPEDRILRAASPPPETVEEAMILGRDAKRRLEEPFISLLDEFYWDVRSADIIVVIGYSFSDSHINKVLVDRQLRERETSFDLIVVNGPDWGAPEIMSNQAAEAWRLLVMAGRQAYDKEWLTGLRVIRKFAEDAVLSGALEEAITGAADRRRFRRND